MAQEEKAEGDKKSSNPLNLTVGGKRISSILVGAMIAGLFMYGLRWGWMTFNANYCMKCFLPTIILSSTIGVALAALINEAIQIIGSYRS